MKIKYAAQAKVCRTQREGDAKMRFLLNCDQLANGNVHPFYLVLLSIRLLFIVRVIYLYINIKWKVMKQPMKNKRAQA